MSFAVQGCFDCQTPMIDMQSSGKCPNCNSRNIQKIVFGSVPRPTPRVKKIPQRFFELTYNGGNCQPTTVFVEADDTQDARRLLVYWCEQQKKTLLTASGQSLCFWPRTSKQEKSTWQKTLSLQISAKLYLDEKPQTYLARSGDGRVIKLSLVTA